MQKEAVPAGFMDFDALVDAADDVFEKPVGADFAGGENDTMLIYFTSGTTGYPKMVAHSFHYPLGHIVTARYWHNIKPGALHLTISDTGWGKAAWGKMYGQWLCEAAVLVYDFDRFNAADILQKLQDYKVNTFCAPPTMYRYIIREPLESYDLSSLVYATTAGEALNPEVFEQFKAKTGLAIHEGFGQTETTMVLATFPCMDIRIGAMGLPTPGYDVQVLDAEGQIATIGETGEICIRYADGKPMGMAQGYYKDEELTNKAWRDGWYHTGDTAWQDGMGYFWYVGRTDDVIKSSGYRIGPFEVESALMEHSAVLECAVTPIPDPVRGQIVKATVVLAKDAVPSDALKKELQNHVKQSTAPYKYPRVVEFADALPKTISGKIKRAEIRERDRLKYLEESAAGGK
jgi:acetyl-CoA synthetase